MATAKSEKGGFVKTIDRREEPLPPGGAARVDRRLAANVTELTDDVAVRSSS